MTKQIDHIIKYHPNPHLAHSLFIPQIKKKSQSKKIKQYYCSQASDRLI